MGYNEFEANSCLFVAIYLKFYNIFRNILQYIRLSGKKVKVLDNSLVRLSNKILLY